MPERREKDQVALAAKHGLRDGDRETFRKRSGEFWLHAFSALSSALCGVWLAQTRAADEETVIVTGAAATAVVVEFTALLFARLTIRTGGLEHSTLLRSRFVPWEEIRTAVTRPPMFDLGRRAWGGVVGAFVVLGMLVTAPLPGSASAAVLLPLAVFSTRLHFAAESVFARRRGGHDLELYGVGEPLLLLQDWPSRRAYDVVLAFLRLHRDRIRIVPPRDDSTLAERRRWRRPWRRRALRRRSRNEDTPRTKEDAQCDTSTEPRAEDRSSGRP